MKHVFFLITATFVLVIIAVLFNVIPPPERDTIGKALVKFDTLGQTQQKYCKAVVGGRVLYRLCN